MPNYKMTKYLNAKCQNAKCQNAETQNAKCKMPKCKMTKCQNAKCRNAKCQHFVIVPKINYQNEIQFKIKVKKFTHILKIFGLHFKVFPTLRQTLTYCVYDIN